MKKAMIILIIMMLIATTFVTVGQGKMNIQNSIFLKTSTGPISRIIDFFRTIPFINRIIDFFNNLFGLKDSTDSEDPEETDESQGRSVPSQSDSIKDPRGDVMHYRWHDGRYGWSMNIGNMPNIDITEVKYEVRGDKVALSLTLDGTIVSSELVSYHGHLNTSDAHYYFMWMNDEGIGWATGTGGGDFQFSDADITVSGKTITATYDIIGTFTKVEDLWGFAAEYTVFGDTSAEWWIDWAPNEESPYTSADSARADVSGGTPGFELVALITAFAAIIFIIKKRENR